MMNIYLGYLGNKMPYIKQIDRKRYDKLIDELVHTLLDKHIIIDENILGDINYIFSKILKKLMIESVGIDNIGYAKRNNIIGVLECAKLEFYRRFLSPYEDQKISENGDI